MDLTPPQVVPGTNRPYNESGRTAERRRFAPRPRADTSRDMFGLERHPWCDMVSFRPATCESVTVLAVAYARN